jgi:hypothetical protein
MKNSIIQGYFLELGTISAQNWMELFTTLRKLIRPRWKN